MKHPLIRAGLGTLAVTLILQVMENSHAHAEHSPPFPGFLFVFGILGGLLLTVFAKMFLTKLISRKPAYYTRLIEEEGESVQ